MKTSASFELVFILCSSAASTPVARSQDRRRGAKELPAGLPSNSRACLTGATHTSPQHAVPLPPPL
jgi:hypothetical protein